MKLAISFSGGRTSAYMMYLLLRESPPDQETAIVFANTGCEDSRTLDFVDACDRLITGKKVVWLEAVVDPKEGVGVRHKIVSYESAARNGEPYESYIAKYGIPNSTSPSCTARLKIDVMESYLRSLGWLRGSKLNYSTAIGIRADEIDRVNPRYKEQRYLYPLIDRGITKKDVIEFWRKQSFDLTLPGEHYGNCVWCWKKTDRKLLTLAIESPGIFDFPRRMEAKYGTLKGNSAAGHGGRRYFFRKHRSVDDLIRESKTPFVLYQDKIPLVDQTELDFGSGCEESCEVYGAHDTRESA